MKFMLVILVVFLGGCSTGSPEIVMANQKAITVSYEPILFTQEAMSLVQDHCKRMGKDAVRTMSGGEGMKTETFECR